jgi:ABC-type nitrate/sulfonate/bicarbonate transport system substrate-binding protein
MLRVSVEAGTESIRFPARPPSRASDRQPAIYLIDFDSNPIKLAGNVAVARGLLRCDRTMKASTISIGLVLMVSAAAAGLMIFPPRSLAPRPADGPLKASLRLNGPFDPSHAGEIVAAQAGLFARVGLQIELVAGAADTDPIALVASGKDTIGVVSADRLLLARGKDVPVVAFAAAYLESPVVFYSLEQSGIRTPNDFVGKRIGYQAGQDTALIYDAMLVKLQFPPSMVRRVPVGSDFSPLVNGNVDVWPGHVASESYELSRMGIGYNSISPASYGVHVPGTVYFALAKTIRDNPTVIRRFLQAIVGGWELTYSDYATSVPLIASFDAGTLTPDLIRFKLEQQREFLRPFGARFAEFDQTRWRSLQDILLQQKQLKEALDLSKIVNFDFLRDVYQRSAPRGN